MNKEETKKSIFDGITPQETLEELGDLLARYNQTKGSAADDKPYPEAPELRMLAEYCQKTQHRYDLQSIIEDLAEADLSEGQVIELAALRKSGHSLDYLKSYLIQVLADSADDEAMTCEERESLAHVVSLVAMF